MPGAGLSPPSLSQKGQVRALGAAARSRHAFLFDGTQALAHARRVDKNDRIAAQIEKHLDQIARGSGNGGRDRDVAARSAFINVDLPTFGGPAITTVKPSRRRAAASAVASARSMRSIARPAARPTHLRVKSDASSTSEKSICVSTAAIASRRLERTACALSAERPPGDALGLSPLRLRLRLDQIGKPLHLGKIDLAVEERAPGEFPGLGQTGVRE